jgi:hypothetical protein
MGVKMKHLVSESCGGETCRHCGRPATHKVGEEIMPDDPHQVRHNLTAYVCCSVFMALFRASCPDNNSTLFPPPWK